MNWLRTARVMVIDDQPEEATPILDALGRLGIGAAYLTGDDEGFPEKPFRGIRLLFLDIALQSTGEEVEAVVSQTIGVLRKVIDSEGGPLVIILWTKHGDYVDYFEQTFKEAFPGIKPGLMATMEKPSGTGPSNAENIKQEIERKLVEYSPIDVICYWEQSVHDAATQTMSDLSKLVPDVNLTGQEGEETDPPSQGEYENWSNNMWKILGALAKASAERNLTEDHTSLQALFSSLNPVHTDSLENLPMPENLSDDVPRNLVGGSRLALTEVEKGYLNRMISVAKIRNNDPILFPGNIYFKEDWPSELDRAYFEITNGGSTQGNLREERLNSLINDIFRNVDEDLLRSLRDDCRIVAVEITPYCDYAQKKQKWLV